MKAAAAAAAIVVVVFVVQGFLLAPKVQAPEPVPLEKPKQVSGSVSNFSGIDLNGKPFSVQAQQGIQDEHDETLMHLKTMAGSFIRREGGEVLVTADTADYEIKTKDLKVTGNVRFREPGRYVANLSSAQVNLERQKIVTHEPVRVTTEGATVSADSMETSEDGKIVTLRGNVKAQFQTDVGQ